jgi:hypothetical protein
MRELVLIQPGSALEGATARELERARADREFEARQLSPGALPPR